MSPDDPPPPHDAPVSGAARCESSFEKRYEMKDRLARGLFTALCRSLNVDAYTLTKSSTAPIYVTADAPTHARLRARWAELLPLYDDLVLAAAGEFIREHCGVEMPPAPRR